MKNTFYLTLDQDYYNKGDILRSDSSMELRVVMTYRNKWWRLLLSLIGTNVSAHEIKVKII